MSENNRAWLPTRILELQRNVARLNELRAQEKTTGKATFEQLNLEDSMGHYKDVLQALVDAGWQALTTPTLAMELKDEVDTDN